MKHVFIKLKIQCGEYEFYALSVHITSFTPNVYAESYAQNFYGSNHYQIDNAYYYYGGEVAVSVYEYREITADNYNILTQFLR
jgi:hypothetical protein